MPLTTLPPDLLRWRVPPAVLDFATTAEIAPQEGVIGQATGLAALRRGVELPSVGFNVFVVGLRSTGRLGTVRRMVADFAPRRRSARDLVYVRNFRDPARPRLLVFPPGRGLLFRKELLKLAARLMEEVPAILGSSELRRARDRQEESAAVAHHGAIHEVEAQAKELGFALAEAEDEDGGTRPVIVWVEPHEGGEAPEEGEVEVHGRAELLVLANTGRLELPLPVEEIMRRFDLLEEALSTALAASRERVADTVRRLATAEEEAVRSRTKREFTELGRKWAAARSWLAELHDELIDTPEWFDEDEPDHEGLVQAFSANVVHSGGRGRAAPIVVVPNPTWHMLLGGIEGEPGAVDHRSIRGGALLDADGGFLVLNAADLLQEPGAWKVLKRALTYGAFDVQNPEIGGIGSMVVLRPESMQLDVRVILLGDPAIYAMLYYGDPDFGSMFKIKAEFEDETPATPEVLRQYVGFLSRLVGKEALPHLTAAAVGETLEWSVRLCGRGGHISTRFGLMSDLVREAAVESAGRVIDATHIREAIAARALRDGLAERRVHESIELGHIRVVTRDAAVGEVNGLAVYHVGGHDFGRPLRVTASVGVGRHGVVSIERESGLSGKSHDKGVQILSGLLRRQFGAGRVFAFTASVGFEQSYGRIDGDSASTAEVYAILSALSGIPLRQDVAVTGSVNQRGEIQSVGGVNEKIEGFFAVCRIQGLTGSQGVVIPPTNVRDLCLSTDVVEACAAGRFHVWTVDTVSEGIELLCGVPAGEAGEDGTFAEGTVFGAVAARLDRFQELARLQGRRPGQKVDGP